MSKFSFNLNIKFAGRKYSDGSTTYLRNIKENHNKYYHITLQHKVGDEFPYQVRIDYGKFGTAGSYKYHKFKDTLTRAEFIDKTIKQKMKKDYEHYVLGKSPKKT